MKKGWGESFHFSAIGVVRTPFADKFGIPRQPGLVSQAKGVIKIASDPDLKTALRSLEEFSHLWIVFVFHQHGGRSWKPSIRPPRLGGERKVGVLSSRSPHRPNPIGLSAVKLERVDFEAVGGPEIHVGGVDLLDGTPVLDIKPYIPYADAIAEARAGWASAPIVPVAVEWSVEAEMQLQRLKLASEDTGAADVISSGRRLRELILEILQLDPRPAFQKRQLAVADPAAEGSRFGIEIAGHEVKYEIRGGRFWVLDVL